MKFNYVPWSLQANLFMGEGIAHLPQTSPNGIKGNPTRVDDFNLYH